MQSLLYRSAIASTALCCLSTMPAFAAPEGGVVSAGSAVINQSGALTTITQGSNVVRIVSEDMNGVSYANGEIINYRRSSTLWLGCPFALDLLTDDERLPRARLSIADPERTIGLQILGWSESPTFKLELMNSSDFSTDSRQ